MKCPLRMTLVGLMVTSAAMWADTPPASATPPSLADLPLEQLMQVPVEFITGASKYEQRIRRAPSSVTVLTAEDIRNFGWRTLADALRSAPGFHIRNDRFYDYIGNRGFTRSYDYNSRTLILLNGHRLNDTNYQTGSVGTEFILDVDMIDRIEIIRGPSSSLYGSSAFYGAINIIPKKGRDIGGGQAAVSVSSEPGAKARITVGNRTPGGVEYVLSATEWTSDGEEDYALPQSWRDVTLLTDTKATDHDDMRHRSLFGHASWKGFEVESAYVRRKKDVLPPVYFTNLTDPAYGIDERAYLLGRVTGEPTADATLTAKVGLDYYSYEGRFSPAFTNFEPQRPYSNSLSLNSEIRWKQDLEGDHIVIAGLEYQNNFIQDAGRDNLFTGVAAVRVRESSHYLSPFAQGDWSLGRDFWLSTGARFDSYSTGERRVNPRLGLIWEASAATTVKLLYGQAFRVPNLEERYAAEAGVVANPDLGPEHNESWEWVADHKLNAIWSVDAHVYHTDASDLIQSVETFSGSGIFTNRNAQKIVSEGVEAGATAYFPSSVQLRGSATLQRAYDASTDVTVADAPRSLAKLNATTPLGVRWLRLSGELQYVGSRRDNAGASVADYLTANLTLRAIQVGRGWDLSFSVYNLLGEEWSDAKNTGQIEAPPRSFVARATFDF